MNVYIVEVGQAAGRARHRGRHLHPRHLPATCRPWSSWPPACSCGTSAPGRSRGSARSELPAQLCAFTAGGAAGRGRSTSPATTTSSTPTTGCPARSAGWPRDRWGVPLVHSMHTLAKVKNAGAGRRATRPSPRARVIGEEQVVAEADRLIANTDEEARQLVELYGADPARVAVVPPGVDLDRFAPGDRGRRPARRLGLPAGRDRAAVRRPHPAAQGARRAAARRRRAARRRPGPAPRGCVVHVVGGPSGSGLGAPRAARRSSPATSASPTSCRFEPPQPADAAGRLVPRRRRRRRALPQRVLRPGRPRGAGLRHAGRGGRRRRPAHRGRATASPASWSTGTTPATTPPVLGRLAARPAARRAVCGGAPCAHAGRVRLDRDGRPAARGVHRSHGSCVSRGVAHGARPECSGSGSDDAGVLEERSDLELSRAPRPGAFLVKLPGEHKLATMTWLVVGEHSLRVEAFFCRQPDENHEQFYRLLLEQQRPHVRRASPSTRSGDVYLTGRLPLRAVTPEEIDRMLGCVLQLRRRELRHGARARLRDLDPPEWAWRVKRGESLANLAGLRASPTPRTA